MELCSIAKWVGGYLIYISPSVVGVFLGAYLVQRYWVRKANEAVLIEYFSKELNELLSMTLDYWALDCSGTGKDADSARTQARKLEQKLKGTIKSLNAALVRYTKRYCSKTDFNELMADVSEACTGGEFEVKKRPADPHRFSSAVSAIHKVRWMLFERRV